MEIGGRKHASKDRADDFDENEGERGRRRVRGTQWTLLSFKWNNIIKKIMRGAIAMKEKLFKSLQIFLYR